MVGAADLPGPQPGAPAADQGDGRGAVVRGTERGTKAQLARGHVQPGSRVDHRHLERFLRRQRRQQARQPRRQHGLARPRRADHEQVVTTGGGHLQGLAPERLAPHLGQVGGRGGVRAGRRRRQLRPRALPPQRLYQGAQVGSGPGQHPLHQARLLPARGWDHHARLAGGGHQGEQARDPSQRAVQAQLGNERPARQGLGGDLAVRRQDAERHRQVQARTRFAQARGRQVDRYALLGPGKTTGNERRPHPVAGFPARGVGQANDSEAG